MGSGRKLVWKAKRDVESNARRVLTAMARDYFQAGRKVAAARPAPAKLHAFRLHTKRFRYTLAMFERLYGPSLQPRLALLKPVQDALGQVNDCVTTRETFDGDETFAAYLERRAMRKAAEFYRAWQRHFDADGQEDEWVRYLEGLGVFRDAARPEQQSDVALEV
jgi:CHAD domain-containing protein